jgi:oligosaccharide repeat unit polymerase
MPTVVFLSYLIAYNIPSKKKIKTQKKVLYFQNKPRVIILSIVLIIIYLIFLYSSGMPRYHLIRILVTISIFFVVIFLLSDSPLLKSFSLFIVVLLISYLFLDLYTRRPIFSVLFPFIYYIFLKQIVKGNSSKNIFKIILLFLSILIIFFLFTAYRISDNEGIDLFSLAESAINIILFGSGFDTIFLTQFVVEKFNFDNYLYGDSFLAGFLNLVPRELWTGKPIAFSITLSAIYFNVSINDVFTNFGPGILAESYANGGIIFVAIVSIFLGIALNIFDKWNSKSFFDFMRFGVSSIFLPSLFFFVRGDFVNAFYEMYFKLLVFFLLTYLFRKYSLQNN